MNGQLNVAHISNTTQDPRLGTFLVLRRLIGLVLFVQLTFVQAASAEIYIYQGPNGERLISDRPPTDDKGAYRLVTKRDTLSNAGHILAKRPITNGGPRRFNQFISAAANQYNVDPALIEAVIQVESAFNPNAVSKKGATGLMQLMQGTAKQYKVKNRFNPKENIYAGVKHLRYLLNRFDGEVPLVLAAYNAGATAVDKYNGIPPYPETRRYVTKVLGYHNRYRQKRYGGS
ncbi:MAG: soluble lytic murein transglycosylase-like protein [Candidatus Azotimanducaceae bacterium]|jgi:soluble lytic murein transglycosylase-like protein